MRLVAQIKRWFLKLIHPQDFSGAPGPQEDLSLRDGSEIIKARQQQGKLEIGSIDVTRDGDRILIRMGTIAFWINSEVGSYIGDMADEIKADRERFIT